MKAHDKEYYVVKITYYVGTDREYVGFLDQTQAGLKLWTYGHARRKALRNGYGDVRRGHRVEIVPLTITFGEPIDVN